MPKKIESKPYKQFHTTAPIFDAYNKNLPIQVALGSERVSRKQEASDIRSLNWIPNVSGWRLTPTGIEFGSVPSGLFPPGSIVFADIQNISTDKILGRDTASDGVIEQLGLGAGLSITGGNLVNTITQYTDELAQDAVGAMVDTTIVYVDGTPLLTRAALTGAITASQASNTTALGSFTKAELDTAVSDGNIVYVGDIPTLAAGVYTPTRSSETNLDANVTMTEAQYMRVGATVTVSGRFTANPTTTLVATNFEITLPVASNLGAVEDVAGTAVTATPTSGSECAEIIGVVANDTAQIQWIPVDTTEQIWSYTFTYQII